jgi:hypothetical protein
MNIVCRLNSPEHAYAGSQLVVHGPVFMGTTSEVRNMWGADGNEAVQRATKVGGRRAVKCTVRTHVEKPGLVFVNSQAFYRERGRKMKV